MRVTWKKSMKGKLLSVMLIISLVMVLILQFMPGGARPSLQSAVQFRHKR